MIFRNTIRLLLTNFSNVWKVLLYYVICISLSLCVCYFLASPIIAKLVEAQIFVEFGQAFGGLFSRPFQASATIFEQLFAKVVEVLTTNIQFRFNYIFLGVWILFIFPLTFDFAQLASGEVLYGFMTSQVQYSWTGRFIKNIGKSVLYSVLRYCAVLVFNVVAFGGIYYTIKFASAGDIRFAFLSMCVFALVIVTLALKQALFSCWMPSIAVLDKNVASAVTQNFACVFRNFWNIFSTSLLLVILSIVINLLCAVFTLSVALVITIPATAFMFVVFQMVSFFSTQGMRFYVYPDMFISPKRFEEQDNIEKMINLI
jgi:hypothetical protein